MADNIVEENLEARTREPNMEKTKETSSAGSGAGAEINSEEDKQTVAAPSLSPVPQERRTPVAPVMTNALPARPSSAASMHSASSSGPRSTIATSRRGGRTRSRSPPMMMSNRPPSTGPPVESYPPTDNRRGTPTSPANPSAAAAAAAAAAKSMARNPPPPASWYDSPEAREREYRRARGEPPRYYSGNYEGGEYPARPHWAPGEEQPGRPLSRNRYTMPRGRPGQDEHAGYREGFPAHRGRRGHPNEPFPPSSYEMEYDRRYVDPRYDDRRYHGGPPPYEYRGREGARSLRREDPYYAQSKPAEGGPPDQAAPVRRTTRVIGGPTPIHLPRADAGPSRSSRGGAPSDSIFRGRPGSDAPKPPMGGDDKGMLALRSPSNSFEGKNSKDASKRDETLSPEAPPQIHHSHHQSDALFDPHRSPRETAGPPQPSSSIDMAPSFNLFNQSFDSIGDTANFFNVSGPLDSALNSTSFGVAPALSKDETTELHLSSSVGNLSQQLLAGSTFEMSPNNSFGNGGSVMRSRGGNLIVLGGGQERPSSPHQFLEGYSSRPYAPPQAPPSQSYRQGPPPYQTFSHPETIDGAPGFYFYLKRHKGAFKDCSFLLPGLKAALLQAPDVKEEASDDTPKRHNPYSEPNPQDVEVARRRVISAVCAFGGTFQGDRQVQQPKSGGTQSIFREKPGEVATVTPNSSASTSPGGHRSRHRAKYDEMLPSRYYENDNRLSWEFEEHPPIDDMGREEEEADERKREEDANGISAGADCVKREGGDNDDDNDDDDDDADDGEKTASESKDGDQPKMKYRCKLCGQPKQNHTCPYQQSLARSIGTMVYPAVNAFTASEPGNLAPALAEMNNFVSGGDSVASNEGASPSRPSRLVTGTSGSVQQVTPESMRSNSRAGLSPTNTPARPRTPSRRIVIRPAHELQRRHMGAPPPSASRGKKRGFSQMSMDADQGDLLFVEAVDLKPEQFRIVTASKIVNAPDAFTYPALPLPYAQRKRLSDNLFSLSKEVPQLTDECAAVLREAREKDMWDLAVAELMTQVVVVVHCHDTDSRFEGLRSYLMTLGISC